MPHAEDGAWQRRSSREKLQCKRDSETGVLHADFNRNGLALLQIETHQSADIKTASQTQLVVQDDSQQYQRSCLRETRGVCCNDYGNDNKNNQHG